MKRIVAIGCALAFALSLGAAGCGDPCEKAFDQAMKCDKGDKLSKSDKKKAKKMFVEMCKDSKEMTKAAKKCAGISNCKKAKKCWRDAKKD